IDLGPLSEEDSETLAEALVRGEGEELEDVRRLLVNHSGGIPLFLEEVLRSLREQGVLQERPGGGLTVTQEPRTVEVPATLRGLPASPACARRTSARPRSPPSSAAAFPPLCWRTSPAPAPTSRCCCRRWCRTASSK